MNLPRHSRLFAGFGGFLLLCALLLPQTAASQAASTLLVAPLVVNEQRGVEAFVHLQGEDILVLPSDLEKAGLQTERLR